MSAVIYRLLDPVTSLAWYVGRTGIDPQRRLSVHVSQARAAASPVGKDAWILMLTTAGKMPQFEAIESVPDNDPMDRERYWIRRHVRRGDPLFNTLKRGKRSPVKRRTVVIGASLEPDDLARLDAFGLRERERGHKAKRGTLVAMLMRRGLDVVEGEAAP